MSRPQRTDGTPRLGGGKRFRPPLLRTSPSRFSGSSHRDGASLGEQFRPGGGSQGLAGASRRRGALRCRGGWHRLAAMGWVPGPQGEGATAGDRQRSALWALLLPLACRLQPRPSHPRPPRRAASAPSAPGSATAGGARPGRRGECTALGLQVRGAQPGPQGLPCRYPGPLVWVSPEASGGGGVGREGGDWMLGPGLGVGAPGIPWPRPLPATLQVSLLQPCFQEIRGKAGDGRGCKPLLGVPIRASPLSACI